MYPEKYIRSALVAATAVLFVGTTVLPDRDSSGPIANAASSYFRGDSIERADITPKASGEIAATTNTALAALGSVVGPLSHPQALATAFRSYFAFKVAHPDQVKKPFLYFVDYGLPSTTPRGYVFDMSSLKVVDGPFAVAHGRGSSQTKYGIPTRFSNRLGSAATSLGLYLTSATYAFRGVASGRSYRSIGLRLLGVSSGFNDNAFVRRVVAPGAPYVTADKAGRSEGCPAMEPDRAKRLLPELSDGGMVFLFAPDPRWMSADPWVAAGN
jgi:hypothetical protein